MVMTNAMLLDRMTSQQIWNIYSLVSGYDNEMCYESGTNSFHFASFSQGFVFADAFDGENLNYLGSEFWAKEGFLFLTRKQRRNKHGK
jgi:hypothetical protein